MLDASFVMIPLELVGPIDSERIMLECTLELIMTVPIHNTHMMHTLAYIDEIFGHYGLSIQM